MGSIMLWDMVDMDYLLQLILEQNWDYLCQDKKTEVALSKDWRSGMDMECSGRVAQEAMNFK